MVCSRKKKIVKIDTGKHKNTDYLKLYIVKHKKKLKILLCTKQHGCSVDLPVQIH